MTASQLEDPEGHALVAAIHQRKAAALRGGTDHNTDYTVYENAESCGCPVPEDETSEAYELWQEDHPQGVTANEDTLQICHRMEIGTYCEECSHDNGEWSLHVVYCDECEYGIEDDGTCQCEPAPVTVPTSTRPIHLPTDKERQ